MTKAVVFDLDGTLIDSLPDMTHSANTLLAEHGLPSVGKVQVAGFVGFGVRVFMERLIAATGLDGTHYDALLERFMALYVKATDHTEVYPGVRDALQTLREQGYALGICTNKPTKPLLAVLQALDLHGLFEVAVAGDTLSQRKPDPAPLVHAFNAMGAIEGVYVGDSIVDGQTAAAAKVPFALFSEGIRVDDVQDIPHDVVFDDFADLPDLCARFTAILPEQSM